MDTFIGLMSGTSLDGIDAAVVRFPPGRVELLAARTTPFTRELRSELLALIQATGTDLLDRFGELDHRLGRLFAEAATGVCDQAGLEPGRVAAIGSHGLTVLHRPTGETPFSLQIGDPNLIAERTGITTVADFRRRDLAAGGQGAPLVPAFHAALFTRAEQARAVVNIGGMANLTLLPGSEEAAVTGFDTGPGNVLLDAWIQQQLGQPYDRDGAWAASGSVSEELLAALLADPYFTLPPPKSTGREHFNSTWLQDRLRGFELEPEAVQATLAELTAASIAVAIEREAQGTTELIVCGGGAYNPDLLQRIGARLPAVKLSVSDDYGLAAEWVEAVAFAWLAQKALEGKPGNVPAVTGAAGKRILGGVYPGTTGCGEDSKPE
ncbi:anhydro-N-acetylmuramic acid kinase [Thiohalobacter thiocyanaticus]|uniref:Anhydro-N-acetylmuramic acid kinase n=1 Tax=Thiohalobacter thiocyanaticus TaxID=585455 RepID=A0A426QKX0_9GAMM|nr:anhydro-N-acetylmuramic acid kinase [Thiohalobacter thiocyanaticus]RRQ22434.1 anhydro-N-acetylmuramic acid kinase [Thiohalobacter thiocyanaticus]